MDAAKKEGVVVSKKESGGSKLLDTLKKHLIELSEPSTLVLPMQALLISFL